MADLGFAFLLFLLGLKMRFEDIREILPSVTNVAFGQTVLQTALAFLVAVALGFETQEILVIALATVFGATPIIVKILTDKDRSPASLARSTSASSSSGHLPRDRPRAVYRRRTRRRSRHRVDARRHPRHDVALSASSRCSPRDTSCPDCSGASRTTRTCSSSSPSPGRSCSSRSRKAQTSIRKSARSSPASASPSSYSKELEDRITPITDFFILVFFATIGLQIDGLSSLLAYWWQAIVASIVLMVGNFWIMFYLIDREGFDVETSFLGSINMVQVSEFSLIVGALAIDQELIGPDVLGYLSLMALLTMGVSTYIIAYNHAIYERLEPWFRRFESDDTTDAEIGTYEDHAIAIGYDEITESALPMLERKYGEVVVIDRQTDHVETRARGRYEYVFGDFRHRSPQSEPERGRVRVELERRAGGQRGVARGGRRGRDGVRRGGADNRRACPLRPRCDVRHHEHPSRSRR